MIWFPTLPIFLLIAAFVLFAFASFNLFPQARVNWEALGLACMVAGLILNSYGAR